VHRKRINTTAAVYNPNQTGPGFRGGGGGDPAAIHQPMARLNLARHTGLCTCMNRGRLAASTGARRLWSGALPIQIVTNHRAWEARERLARRQRVGLGSWAMRFVEEGRESRALEYSKERVGVLRLSGRWWHITQYPSAIGLNLSFNLCHGLTFEA